MDNETLSDVLSNLFQFSIAGLTVGKLLGAAVLVLVGLVVIKLLLGMLERLLTRMKVEPTLLGMGRAVLKVLMLLLLVLMVVGYLGLPLSPLVAGLSVVGLAVSLGVQNFLTNVVGGLQLLASHPFKVGDYVEAGGCAGTVQEIGMFYTKVITPDNKLIQLPNSSIVSANITNYSYEPLRRVDLTITASYDAPVETVKRSLSSVVKAHPKTLDDPAPIIRVNNYLSSSIEYTVRAWCSNADYWEVYFDLMEGVKTAFDRDGIEMTYDHLNVHMMEH